MLCLVKRRGLGDALRTLFRREGIDQQMGRADKALFHGGSGLNGHQLVHQVLIEAATELGQGFGQDKMGLGAIGLALTPTASLHDCHVGA